MYASNNDFPDCLFIITTVGSGSARGLQRSLSSTSISHLFELSPFPHTMVVHGQVHTPSRRRDPATGSTLRCRVLSESLLVNSESRLTPPRTTSPGSSANKGADRTSA